MPEIDPTKAPQLAVAKLIARRCADLGLTHAQLARRVGYANEAKGIRRLEAFIAGDFERTQFLQAQLPAALGVKPEQIQAAISETAEQLAALEQAEYREDFRPNAIVLTEREIPSQIFAAVVTGAAEQKWIDLDLSKSSASYIQQALRHCPDVIHGFGKSTGIIINYSPDYAVRFNLNGHPVEVLTKAHRLGAASLVIGSRRIDPKRANHLAWGDGDIKFVGFEAPTEGLV